MHLANSSIEGEKMYNQKIGIVGGFGAYATLGFFESILKEFATDCERNYPHIIMDNNFTMPSRTRALLTGEDYEFVVREMAESFRKMCDYNVDYIILPCGTAHAFLDDVYYHVPEAKNKVLNLVEVAAKELEKIGVKNILVIAAEGTMKQKIYSPSFGKCGIECSYPKEEDYFAVRSFIECVKRNACNKDSAISFLEFLKKYNRKDILLGCTEFPVFINYISSLDEKEELDNYAFWNPLEMVLKELKRIIK